MPADQNRDANPFGVQNVDHKWEGKKTQIIIIKKQEMKSKIENLKQLYFSVFISFNILIFFSIFIIIYYDQFKLFFFFSLVIGSTNSLTDAIRELMVAAAAAQNARADWAKTATSDMYHQVKERERKKEKERERERECVCDREREREREKERERNRDRKERVMFKFLNSLHFSKDETWIDGLISAAKQVVIHVNRLVELAQTDSWEETEIIR